MFLTATLTLNPSSPTDRVALDEEGGKSDLPEVDALSTSRVLQQLVLTMRDAGLTNASLLSHDGQMLFEDWTGKEDDLTEAVREFGKKSSIDARQQFRSLRLVLDHQGPVLNIVVDARVDSVRNLATHAFEIHLTGFLQAFHADDEMSPEQHQLFGQLFEEQEAYEQVCQAARVEFHQLIESIRSACLSRMQLERIKTDVMLKMVQADPQPLAAIIEWRNLFDPESVCQDDVLYCYFWHQNCRDHLIDIQNCELVDGKGTTVHRYYRPDIDEPRSSMHGATSTKTRSNPLRNFSIPKDRLPSGTFSILGPSTREMWEVVAREIGAEFVIDGFLQNDRIVYVLGTQAITLDTFIVPGRGDNDSDTIWTSIDAKINSPLKFQCEISPRKTWDAVKSLVGSLNDIEIGDRAFDEAFVIRGTAPEAIKEFLSDSHLRKLIKPGMSLSISNRITQEFPGITMNAESLVRRFELFIELLQRLEELQ